MENQPDTPEAAAPAENVEAPPVQNSPEAGPSVKKIRLSTEESPDRASANNQSPEQQEPPPAEVPNENSVEGNEVQVENMEDSPAEENVQAPNADEEMEEDPLKLQCFKYANLVLDNFLCSKVEPSDEVEKRLLHCVEYMLAKHEIGFNAMKSKINLNSESGYETFVSVADELFERERTEQIHWGRIIALYAFAVQLAMKCREENRTQFLESIREYLGRYAWDVASSYIRETGGWATILTEFPTDDSLARSIWSTLKWTAVGLGLATATLYLTK